MTLTTEIMEKTIKILKKHGKFDISSMKDEGSGVVIYVHNLYHFSGTSNDLAELIKLGWFYNGTRFFWHDESIDGEPY